MAHEPPPPPSPSTTAGGYAFTHDLPHPIFALAVSTAAAGPKLALGSFIENLHNRVDLLSFDTDALSFSSSSCSFDHPYPATKLQFHPCPQGPTPPLLASSSDAFRLWRASPAEASADLRCVLSNATSSDFCAPLTSFDWNPYAPHRVGTASVDTTCTVWDVDRGAIETQLIAHDKAVHDIAWGQAGIFASVSADGSVRIFDLRDREHSTILYESPVPDTALLRIGWNRVDTNYMAVVTMDSSRVVVLDIRSPVTPVAELARHHACANAVAWAPSAPRHLCSAGDDGLALIWDLGSIGSGTALSDAIDPVFMYNAEAEINQLQWSSAHPDWIAVTLANKVQLLRV